MKPALESSLIELGRQAWNPKVVDASQVCGEEEVKTGTDVITEGDLNASFFYIVKSASQVFLCPVSFCLWGSSVAWDNIDKSRSGKFDVIQLGPHWPCGDWTQRRDGRTCRA